MLEISRRRPGPRASASEESNEDRSDDLRPGPRRLPGARPGADPDLRAGWPEPRHGRALRHWQRPVPRLARPHHVHDDDDERCDAVLRLRRPPHGHGHWIASPLMGRSSRPCPPGGRAVIGQRARGVVSLHLRTLAREGRMTVTIGRRELLAALGGAAAAWPLAARAQQPAMPVVGFLRSTTATSAAHLVAAFRQGLNEVGFVEGQSVAIDYRWADNQNDRLLPGLVAEMV